MWFIKQLQCGNFCIVCTALKGNVDLQNTISANPYSLKICSSVLCNSPANMCKCDYYFVIVLLSSPLTSSLFKELQDFNKLAHILRTVNSYEIHFSSQIFPLTFIMLGTKFGDIFMAHDVLQLLLPKDC